MISKLIKEVPCIFQDHNFGLLKFFPFWPFLLLKKLSNNIFKITEMFQLAQSIYQYSRLSYKPIFLPFLTLHMFFIH